MQAGQAERALLIPDLFGYWLTGQAAAELTNASTTGLLDVTARHWDERLFQRLELPVRFPAVAEPGTVLGPVLPAVAEEAGLSSSALVTLVGSHDTASAVAGVPAAAKNFAYISCGPGRWSAWRLRPRLPPSRLAPPTSATNWGWTAVSASSRT